jgi:hypothetical protein
MQHLSEPGHQVQAPLDVRPDIVQPEAAGCIEKWLPVEDREPGHVHGRPAVLGQQVRRILRCQPVEHVRKATAHSDERGGPGNWR